MPMQSYPKQTLPPATGKQEDRDPQRILDLIKQLDLDLIETEKKACQRE
ncbi:MAG: hypothetical protein JST79_12420 [Acidobacteria bacterium]|jgi:hypothetical protein|nr:hypothetical protein [Acidobacteriota bacterium]